MKKLLLSALVLCNTAFAGINIKPSSENPLFYYGVCKIAKDRHDIKTAYEFCREAVKRMPDTPAVYRETIFLAYSLGI